MIKVKENLSLVKAKRGISPLVATVLLIAFAVGLGAVIFSWATPGECKEISLEIEKIGEKPQICFDQEEGSIEMTVINTGQTLSSLKIVVVGTTDAFDKDLEGIIESGGVKKFFIPYESSMYGTPSKIRITPIIVSKKGNVISCSSQAYQKEGISSCNW